MSMFGIFLKTSPARFAVLPLAVFLMFILFQRNNFWIGIWPESGAAVATCAFFASYFAAGISAWCSARHNTHRMRELVASTKYPWVSEGLRAGATIIWIWTSYLVVVLAAAIVTVPEGAPGVGFFTGYVLLGLFVITFASFWGWGIGRFLSPAMSASVAFFTWFIFSSVYESLGVYTPYSGPASEALNQYGIVINWMVLLALGVCLIALASRPIEKFVAPALTAAVVAIFLLVSVSQISVKQPIREPVADPLCAHLTIEYCFWPENKRYLQLADKVDAQVVALPVAWRLPERITESGLSGNFMMYPGGIVGEREGEFDPSFAIQEGNQWSLAGGVTSAILSEATRECEFSPDNQTYKIEQLAGWLEQRLAGNGPVPYSTDAHDDYENAWAFGRHMTSEPDEAQGAWADALLTEILSTECEDAA